jgi:hypothetical protein
VGGAAVAALVGLLGARGEGLVLGLFVAGGVAEAVVFAFRVGGGGVVEGWRWVLVALAGLWCVVGWWVGLTVASQAGGGGHFFGLVWNECDLATG